MPRVGLSSFSGFDKPAGPHYTPEVLKRLSSAARLLLSHVSGRRTSYQERFDWLFTALPDPWKFEGSSFERERYDRLFAALSDRRYDAAMEAGCAEGHFTGRLFQVADRVTALDVSPVALSRARPRAPGAVFLQHDLSAGPIPGGPYDLIVASEVLYFLEAPAQLQAVASRLVDALSPGGRLVLAHMRLLKDDVSGHARTVSGYPRIGAATVHPWFKQEPRLTLLREDLQPLYAICVLERQG